MTRLPSISSLISPPDAKRYTGFRPKLKSAEQSLIESRSPGLGNKPPSVLTSHSPSMTVTRILPSPPVSPWPEQQFLSENMEKEQGNITDGDTYESRDPVLYPAGRDRPEIPPDQPLFPSDTSMETVEEIVTNHILMHMAQFDKKFNRPTREEYLLALSCVPNIGASYNRNPGAYMKRTREETEEQYWKAKRICAKPGTKAQPPILITPAPWIKQPKRAIKPSPSPHPTSRTKRTPKNSPIAKLMGYPAKGRSATPEVRSPGTKRPEDVDYNALSDYAPPTSTLPPGNPKSLKADWPSNNLLNLSSDPNREMLHEAELNLAATLRLTCATYLCSKRRIFEARLNALKIGKEFRKTDAQQACKIDVNKASKLWTAYDKVGWFNKTYFQKYL